MSISGEQRLNEAKEHTYSVENLTFSILVDYASDFLMPAKYNQPFTHPYCKAYAVSSGELTVYLMRYTNVTLYENDVIFIREGVKHAVRDLEGSCQYHAVGLRYKKNNLRGGRDYYRHLSKLLVKPYFVIRNVPKLTELLNTCFEDVWLNRKRSCELSAHALILEMVSGFKEDAVPKTADPADGELSRLHKVNTILLSYYDKDITLSDVAKILYLSPRQTGRIIKSNFGMTWRELLIRRRMRVALWTLGKHDDSVESVAAYVGYRSVRGFYSTFEKFYGNPPNFYRNQPELVDEILEKDEEWKDYDEDCTD